MKPVKNFLTALFFLSVLQGIAQNGDTLEIFLTDTSIHDTIKIKRLKVLAFDYIYKSPDTAILLSNQLLLLSTRQNDIKHQIRAYRRLGMAYEVKGELDSALTYFEKSMDLRQKTGDESSIALGYSGFAGLMITKGDYESALSYYDQALEIYKRLNEEKKMPSVYNNKGIAYQYLGDIRNAIDNYLISMQMDEKFENYARVATSKGNIGMLYHKIGDLDKASEYLLECYNYYENSSEFRPSHKLKLLEALAVIESDKGNLEKAKIAFTENLKESRELKFPDRVVSSLVNRGLVYTRMDEFNKAVSDFEEAIRISEEIGLMQNLQITLINQGAAYLEMGNLEKAIEVCNKAIELNKDSPSIVEAKSAYATLYEAYKKKGQNAIALEMYENFILLRDSLESQETKNILTDREFKYKYEKKALSDSLELAAAHQIALTRQKYEYEKKQNLIFFIGGLVIFSLILGGIISRLNQRRKELRKETERAVMEFQIAKSEMKALRSQMNPHFIFRSLQSIQNFMLKNKLEDANSFLLKFQKLMRAVLENSELEEVPIMEELEALKLYMELESLRLDHPFSYTINIDEEIDQIEVSIPPLILQPIIENAIWHGLKHKKSPGHIELSIKRIEDDLICIIEDNGAGRNQIKSTEQFNLGKKKSFGLKITRERLNLRDQRTNAKSNMKIEDLISKDGAPCGTRVELIISTAA